MKCKANRYSSLDTVMGSGEGVDCTIIAIQAEQNLFLTEPSQAQMALADGLFFIFCGISRFRGR